jgi:hypothetical protein
LGLDLNISGVMVDKLQHLQQFHRQRLKLIMMPLRPELSIAHQMEA